MEIKINDRESLPQAADQFAKALGAARHVAFDGPMGAGKTTFIAALCAEMGVEDEVNSPTFSIINEYRDGCGREIFHFDFYRVESEAEAADLGLEEYFDSGSLCLMEWADNAGSLLPDDLLRVEISVAADGSRMLRWED